MQYVIIKFKDKTIRLERVNFKIDDNWIDIYRNDPIGQVSIPIQEISYYSKSEFYINQYNMDYFFKIVLKDTFSGFVWFKSELAMLQDDIE